MRKLSQDFQVVVTFNAIIHTVCYNLTERAPVSSGAEYMYRSAITSSRQYLDPDLKASSREGQKWEKRTRITEGFGDHFVHHVGANEIMMIGHNNL